MIIYPQRCVLHRVIGIMGNGASQSLRQNMRHSDSRISAIRLDGDGMLSDVPPSRGQGNNTVTLRFSMHDYAPTEDDHKARDALGTIIHSDTGLQTMDEGREDHNSSAASLVRAKSNNEVSPRADDNEETEGTYDDESFEDDTIEWKRGEALGSGSYGTVYLARDERTGALMAVKEIVVAEESEDEVRQASREVELLRSLRHTNVVKYLGSRVDYEARKLHIFTEWVPGGNLEQHRKRFGGGERVVRRFTRQILRGVAYLHSKRIVHHDIKPSNLLVDQWGVVKLADFGSSRLLSTVTLINNESMRGTPNYMAPEVIKMTGPRSFKSDIWSVGCSVLRLLTGLPLWGDKHFDSQIALLYYIAHMDHLPPLPVSLSPEARWFIALCLELDPEKRPSAEELLHHPFVGGDGGMFGNPSSFLLPSRSTMVTLRTSNDQRVATAPTDTAHTSDTTLSSTHPIESRRTITSAPAASMAPTTSKSQLVGTRYPSRAIVHKPGDEDAAHENPEIPSMRSKPNSPMGQSRSSRTLGSAAASIVGSTASDQTDVYTFSEFAETVATTPRLGKIISSSGNSVRTTWEDQPILTDGARAERERQFAQVAEEKRKKEERERKFQEELVEFRRLALQSQAR